MKLSELEAMFGKTVKITLKSGNLVVGEYTGRRYDFPSNKISTLLISTPALPTLPVLIRDIKSIELA